MKLEMDCTNKANGIKIGLDEDSRNKSHICLFQILLLSCLLSLPGWASMKLSCHNI